MKWAASKLDELGEIYCGQSVSETEVNRSSRGMIYVTGPEQWNGRHIEQNKWTEYPRRVVPQGCVFITVKGAGVGKTFPGIAAAIGRDIYAYKPSEKLDAEFIHRAIRYRINTLISEARGDIPGLSREHLADYVVPIPPLAEQRRIVAKLNGLTAHIARARAELARVSHLASQLRDQTLSNAISGDLTRDFRTNTDTSWPEKTLQQIATVITGSTPPTIEKDRLFGGPHAFFKPTDLDAGYHVSVPRETLSEEGFRRSRSVPAGSTLVTCIGATISKTGFARVACAFNQQINAIVPKENTVPEWLFWAVSSPSFRSKIINNSSATTMPIINKSRFQQLTLAIPPIVEQREIVGRIEAAFASADRLEAEAARATVLLNRLEASILAKAFRGELVPQDPADEPADALIDRIRTERAAAPKVRRARGAGERVEVQ